MLTRSSRRTARAFTLIELIVVILILGILAAVATVGYSAVTSRAQTAAARANLTQIAKAGLAQATLESAGQLTRAQFRTALAASSIETVDAIGALAATTWKLGGASDVPDGPDEFAIGFDTGAGTAADNLDGTRAVIVTHAAGTQHVAIVSYGGDTATGTVPAGTSPADVSADPSLVQPTEGGSAGGDNTAADLTIRNAAVNQLPSVEQTYWQSTESAIIGGESFTARVTAWPAATAWIDTACSAAPDAQVADIDIVTDSWLEDGAWYVEWRASAVTPAPSGRTYTCTLTARDEDGNALATETATAATPSWPAAPTHTPTFSVSPVSDPQPGGPTHVLNVDWHGDPVTRADFAVRLDGVPTETAQALEPTDIHVTLAPGTNELIVRGYNVAGTTPWSQVLTVTL